MDYQAIGWLTATCRKKEKGVASHCGGRRRKTNTINDIKENVMNMHVAILFFDQVEEVCLYFLLLFSYNSKIRSQIIPLGTCANLPPPVVCRSHRRSRSEVRLDQTSRTHCRTSPRSYMYTWSGYVNFDMWVSISPIFAVGFIRP